MKKTCAKQLCVDWTIHVGSQDPDREDIVGTEKKGVKQCQHLPFMSTRLIHEKMRKSTERG